MEKAAKPSSVSTGERHTPRVRQRLRVLIVEDNADSGDSLGTVLRHFGHDVEVTRNGTQALRAAEAHQPDVVLMDLGLPGQDGYQVAQALRAQKETKGFLLIAVTGYGLAADHRRSHLEGFDFHLVKPYDPAELNEKLLAFAGERFGS